MLIVYNSVSEENFKVKNYTGSEARAIRRFPPTGLQYKSCSKKVWGNPHCEPRYTVPKRVGERAKNEQIYDWRKQLVCVGEGEREI